MDQRDSPYYPNSCASPKQVNLCTDLYLDNSEVNVCSKTLLTDVRACGTNKALRCYCILDEQSNSSFVDIKLISELQLNPPLVKYSIKTLNGFESDVSGHLVDNLEIRGVREN